VAGLQDVLKDLATGPSQSVDVMANDDAMSERSRLYMTGSCLTRSDLLASNAQLFDIFMYRTNPELGNCLTVNVTVTTALLFCAEQQGHYLLE
jgi:hypothetical protein